MIFEIVSTVIGIVCFKYVLTLIDEDQKQMEKYELKK
jgi:hypothetical protein